MAASLSAEQARAAWLQHLAHERRASPRTLEAYGFAAARYIAFLERHRGEALRVPDLATVTAAEVRAWLAHLRAGDHPLSPRSLSQALSEPALDPDREDWEAARDKAVLSLLYGCGLRISEALSLKRSDAPLGDLLRITGKGNKTRMVPVLPAVREAVDAYLAALPMLVEVDAPLFRAKRGGALSS